MSGFSTTIQSGLALAKILRLKPRLTCSQPSRQVRGWEERFPPTRRLRTKAPSATEAPTGLGIRGLIAKIKSTT